MERKVARLGERKGKESNLTTQGQSGGKTSGLKEKKRR
jgi:hypothetical protein